jgi:hypothetical protein
MRAFLNDARLSHTIMKRLDKIRAAGAEAVGARLFVQIPEDEQADLGPGSAVS